MANIADFAIGQLASTPANPLTATSLTLKPGEGALMPAVPFNVTAAPVGFIPTKSVSERMLVTNRVGDVLTVQRAQGGTTAKSLAAGWVIVNSIFVEDIFSNSNSVVTREGVSGTIDGVNKVFTTVNPYIGGTSELFVNGLRQSSIHYTETNPLTGTLTFDEAPIVGDIIDVNYMRQALNSGNSDTVDGFHASSTPTANTLLPLDADKTIPALPSPSLRQVGWENIAISTPSNKISKIVTFPTPLKSVPRAVLVVPTGYSVGAPPTSLAGYPNEYASGFTIGVSVYGISANGFSFTLAAPAGVNFGVSNTGVSWMAEV